MRLEQVPRRAKEFPWKNLGRELKSHIKEDNVFNGAAALAYYLTLAIFPGLIFLLSLLPYLPIPHLHEAIMDLLHQALPREAAGLLSETVESIVTERQGGLLSFGFLGTLWAASAGMYAVMQQLNITYGVKEGRPFLKARAMSVGLTALFGALVIGAFALIVLGGYLESFLGGTLGWSGALVSLFAALRWAIILASMLLGFALVYYLAPNVDQKFKWVSPGSVLGTATLVAASLALQVYVQNFGSYDATYGGLGAVIVLMLWLYVAGLVLLLGSEVNVVFEAHVSSDGRPGQGPRTRGGATASA